jgi:hypothetical protein
MPAYESKEQWFKSQSSFCGFSPNLFELQIWYQLKNLLVVEPNSYYSTHGNK